MNTRMLPAALLLAGLTGPVAAEDWTVKVKAVNGRVTYSHSQVCPVGEAVSFSGKPRSRGMGRALEMNFSSLLEPAQDGFFRLDYKVEFTGANRARPPFQAAGKALLRPGKSLLAAEAGGWKFFLELEGEAGGKARGRYGATLKTVLKCGRSSYPVSFEYLPGEQYSAVTYRESEDGVSRLLVGLLPNSPAVDGTFLLQYTLLLKEGGETQAEGQGELIVTPAGGKVAAAIGKNCVFSARALR